MGGGLLYSNLTEHVIIIIIIKPDRACYLMASLILALLEAVEARDMDLVF